MFHVFVRQTPILSRSFSMKPFFRALLCVCLLAGVSALRAQTETTATLGGTVTAADSRSPVAGANVTLKFAATGDIFTTRTNSAGQYFFAGLRVDDGYTLVATAPGYDTQTIGPFSFGLGEEKQVDIVFANPKDEVVQLDRMTVTAQRERPSPGTSTTLSQNEIEGRPAALVGANEELELVGNPPLGQIFAVFADKIEYVREGEAGDALRPLDAGELIPILAHPYFLEELSGREQAEPLEPTVEGEFFAEKNRLILIIYILDIIGGGELAQACARAPFEGARVENSPEGAPRRLDIARIGEVVSL